jgi:MYXO-CTERM domain-containing protein
LQADCVANQCATSPVAGCTDDLATPPPPDDLAVAVAAPDLSTATSIAGGGGCSFARGASSPGAIAFVALSLLALALRRRRA